MRIEIERVNILVIIILLVNKFLEPPSYLMSSVPTPIVIFMDLVLISSIEMP